MRITEEMLDAAMEAYDGVGYIGESWADRTALKDAIEAAFDARPQRAGLIEVAPLREAFLASSLTPGDVCRRLGWLEQRYGRRAGSLRPQVSRLKRLLGLTPYWRNRELHTAKSIDRDRALLLARAMDLDPVDVGL